MDSSSPNNIHFIYYSKQKRRKYLQNSVKTKSYFWGIFSHYAIKIWGKTHPFDDSKQCSEDRRMGSICTWKEEGSLSSGDSIIFLSVLISLFIFYSKVQLWNYLAQEGINSLQHPFLYLNYPNSLFFVTLSK